MTRVEVNPGVCGLMTVIRAQSDNDGLVRLEVEGECPAVKRLAGCLGGTGPCTKGGPHFQ